MTDRRVTAAELRRTFVEFFKERGHLVHPAASLVPSSEDRSLLFTSAGMVQFKPYFAGELEPPSKRIVTVQKCVRTTDVEEVGDDTHLTLFEMLGNFSFGDYFKREACQWAMELMIKELKFDPKRLFYSVHNDDDESYEIWRGLEIPEKRIYRFGDEDNWWGPAGSEGPCGPCSEIHIYLGDLPIDEKLYSDPSWGPNVHPDFVELYNLVFTEYYRDSKGNDRPLENKNIDTGMGLERTLAVLNGVDSAYECGDLAVIYANVEKLVNAKDLNESELRRHTRIISDHTRAATLLIGDGVTPSNTGRGYVLRRILRRTGLSANKLKIDNFAEAMPKLASTVIEIMGEQYPELRKHSKFTQEILRKEEQEFQSTLTRARKKFKSRSGWRSNSDISRISGLEAIGYYEEYGLPIEVMEDLAREYGLKLDKEGLLGELAKRREISKKANKFATTEAIEGVLASKKLKDTEFKGYEGTEAEGNVLVLMDVKEQMAGTVAALHQQVQVVLDTTAFYAERGGQMGDTGTLEGDTCILKVENTTHSSGNVIIHHAKVVKGHIEVGDRVVGRVDAERRQKIMRNHTATHLIHAALREVLGPSAMQVGSLVHPDYLRFDFSHLEPLTQDEVWKVQDIVNAKIRDNLAVEAEYVDYGKAVADGALAFFGDRYDLNVDVRTIKIDAPWSYELCGGTHMPSTGGIGLFMITSESGIGSGSRRIFAITGVKTEEYIKDIQLSAAKLKVQSVNIVEKIEALKNETQKKRMQLKEYQKLYAYSLKMQGRDESSTYYEQIDKVTGERAETKLRSEKRSELNYSFEHRLNTPRDLKIDVRYFEVPDVAILRKAGDKLRAKPDTDVAIVLGKVDDKVQLIVALSKALASEKIVNAGGLTANLTKLFGGSGGGRPDMGQGGGKFSEGILDLFKQPQLVKTLDRLYDQVN